MVTELNRLVREPGVFLSRNDRSLSKVLTVFWKVLGVSASGARAPFLWDATPKSARFGDRHGEPVTGSGATGGSGGAGPPGPLSGGMEEGVGGGNPFLQGGRTWPK